MTGASVPPVAPETAMRVIALCFAVGILEGFDIQIVGVAAPRMAPALGLDPISLSWIFFASNLGLLFGASAGGWLADKRGRRPVMIGAVAVFGVFTLATVAASTLIAIAATRFMAGLGLGAALPNLVATAADVSRPERRAFTTAAMFCGVPLGGAAVALISQALPDALGWEALFVIGGALPLILAAVQWRWLAETRPSASSAQVTKGIGWALFSEGRLAATLLLWTVVVPTLAALYLVLYWLPTLVAEKGLARDVAAQASAAFNLGGVLGALALGKLVDRVGARLAIGGGFAAFVAVAVALAEASAGGWVLLLSAAAGFLLLGLNYAVYGVAAAGYPEAARATGTGAALGVGRLGSVIGPTLPGFLIAAGAGPNAIIWLLAPAAGVAGVASVLLDLARRRATRAG